MRIGSLDTGKKVVIIAEVGNNHEGDVELAKRMVAAAAKAGADAVKFQTLRPEGLVRPQDEARFAALKRFELSFAQFEDLAATARDEGVLFLSTPFDLEAAEYLNGLVPAFKIASGDNNFIPLLSMIASFGKPAIMSTGLAGLADVRYAKSLMERVWRGNGADAELAVLHCVTSYPTPAGEANLAAIRLLQQGIGGCVGYSDHCLGIEAAVASVAVGARIVEKHFTLDKNHSAFRDHQLSADPADLAEMVRRIRELELMLGSGDDELAPSEAGNLVPVRRSIAAAGDLAAGHILRWEDLCWLRPGEGLAPGGEHLLLGRALKRDTARGTLLGLDMVD